MAQPLTAAMMGLAKPHICVQYVTRSPSMRCQYSMNSACDFPVGSEWRGAGVSPPPPSQPGQKGGAAPGGVVEGTERSAAGASARPRDPASPPRGRAVVL